MLTGKHLIAGNWVASTDTFTSSPATGSSHTFSKGTPALVDQAVKAAEWGVVTKAWCCIKGARWRNGWPRGWLV